MDYMNIDSIQATITSYMEAFGKMKEYCPIVEPSSNESNSRIVLPTKWRPSGKYDADKLRRDANELYVDYASLMGLFDSPRILKRAHRDYKEYFKVSWRLAIPFDIYAWESGRSAYTDEDGEKVPYQPSQMAKWCSPQYLRLGEFTGWAMKAWSLDDWQTKRDEIESFMDDNPNLKEKYRIKVEEADKEFSKWGKAIGSVIALANSLKIEGR